MTDPSPKLRNGQRMRHSSSLPSTGLDILLVGPSDLCQPLAESMLCVQFDRKRKRQERRSRTGAAIEALRSHLHETKSDVFGARHVHIIESLQHFDGIRVGNQSQAQTKMRMDHIVLVVSQSNPEASKDCVKEAAKYLDDDYAIMQRLSVVTMKSSENRDLQWESFLTLLRGKRKQNHKLLFASSVPVFQCRLNDAASRLTSSHILLQRAKLGTRQAPFLMSPLAIQL